MEGPSIAAIVVPWDLNHARLQVATAMRALNLAPHGTPLPRGYRPAPGEFVGWVYRALPDHQDGRQRWPNTALISPDVARIFHLAMGISQAHPDEVLVAWRRFSGFASVAKVLWGGKPRWREGEDHDHELTYVLPTTPPAELRAPGEAKVPLGRAGLDPILLGVVTPVRDVHAEGGEGWLSRRSPLA